jgi:hypothetical protein
VAPCSASRRSPRWSCRPALEPPALPAPRSSRRLHPSPRSPHVPPDLPRDSRGGPRVRHDASSLRSVNLCTPRPGPFLVSVPRSPLYTCDPRAARDIPGLLSDGFLTSSRASLCATLLRVSRALPSNPHALRRARHKMLRKALSQLAWAHLKAVEANPNPSPRACYATGLISCRPSG